MDKRYLLIILIIIVCLINMSLIVNFSDEIGTASVSVDRYIFSIPSDFSLLDSNDHSVVIGHKDNNFRITVFVDNDNNFTNRIAKINSTPEDSLLSMGSINCDGVEVHSVYYTHSYDSSKPPLNQSLFYFEKEGASFRVLMSDFNYELDRNNTIDYITVIVNSLRLDYKKS